MKFRGKRKPQHYDADCGIALPWKPEHALELNALLDPLPMLLLQPVIQYYENVGGGSGHAVVFGFRTKVEF